ncbi:hypothetical protein J3L18_04345 [Mucilaginibacter gossypii]|uniref:hypothetical protein n=1 Tax=Mucilaginibacter gossypii TaxID=551996 RepID=UPI000DCB2DC6|nr:MULTISPECIES: hypothetical protein [Mucilaginibacter]QTE38314.1 hypothetical protein J3L18_04345 [Mucilaginibacter gossypii]RAV49269.1 hypothetical protein DIU36_27770 [Mucilaginibacter rubeus]
MALELKILNGDNELSVDGERVIRFHFAGDDNSFEVSCIGIEELRDMFHQRSINMDIKYEQACQLARENTSKK